ncbi:MAG: thiamine-phosphate kinase [Bacteroidota bacterium]|nr:thiamine-phosphate kinase [Bacteroidota bacterium]
MFENTERTELSSLGEFGLIDHLAKHFEPKHKSSHLGIGDDAALIKLGTHVMAISTDMLVEGVHFDLTYTPLKHLGYKAVTANLSDIAAMNAKPSQITVSIGMSNRFSLEAVEELYEGMRLACEKYKVDLIGGDTTSSRSGLVISVTAMGEANLKKTTYRKGAKPGDLLVVSGDIGGAYMGLQILEREKRVFMEHKEMQPDLEPYDYIVGRQLKPEARLDIIDRLEELKIVPTSMIDVSDGVASEIHHLGQSSDVGFDIYEDKLPIDPQTMDTALSFELNPSIAALNGGEDYELLFTVSQDDYDKMKSDIDFTIIGHATDTKEVYTLHTKAGNSFGIKAQGWDHLNETK